MKRWEEANYGLFLHWIECLSTWVWDTTWKIALWSKHQSTELIQWNQIGLKFNFTDNLFKFLFLQFPKGWLMEAHQFGNENWRIEKACLYTFPEKFGPQRLVLLGKQPTGVALPWATNQIVAVPLRTDREAMKLLPAVSIGDCLLNQVRTAAGVITDSSQPSHPTNLIRKGFQTVSTDGENAPQGPRLFLLRVFQDLPYFSPQFEGLVPEALWV